jgi:hypothetical protein
LRRGRHDGDGKPRRGGNGDGEAEDKCSHWPAQSCAATPRWKKAPFAAIRHKILTLIR